MRRNIQANFRPDELRTAMLRAVRSPTGSYAQRDRADKWHHVLPPNTAGGIGFVPLAARLALDVLYAEMAFDATWKDQTGAEV
jgi:hypothetical protein